MFGSNRRRIDTKVIENLKVSTYPLARRDVQKRRDVKKKKTCAYGTVLFARENAEFFFFASKLETLRVMTFMIYEYTIRI